MSLHINYGPATEEIHREELSERWCFSCRKRVPFVYTVRAPIEPSYYDPTPAINCGNCGKYDGDCGFGGYREWA